MSGLDRGRHEHEECPSCGRSVVADAAFCGACGARLFPRDSAPDDPLLGSLVAGGYRVLDVLGEGAMGKVYRAEQANLGRKVALKVMSPALVAKPEFVHRFQNEARAASSLNHPNIVRVYDFGSTADARPYLVMELLEGSDLEQLTREQARPMPIARVVDIVVQVLSALEEAHSCGVVHRDLKPANVFVSPLRKGGDLVKVLDFGLAKLRARASAPSGLVFGTPQYIAPEQARGEPSDARSDLYSVGVMLFELVAGVPPFRGGDAETVLELQAFVDPPSLLAVAPERATPALARVVAKALAKSPSARYASAPDFTEALREAAIGEQAPASVRRPSWHGASLPIRSCDECGHVLPEGARFCGECGASADLERQPTLELVGAPEPPPLGAPARKRRVSDGFVGRKPSSPGEPSVRTALSMPPPPSDRASSRTIPAQPILPAPSDASGTPSERAEVAPVRRPSVVVRAELGPAVRTPSVVTTATSGRPSSIRPPVLIDEEVEAAARENANLALMFLEQLAIDRSAANDYAAAIVALERAVSIARADLDRGELDDPLRAAAIFSGKLADAQAEGGELRDALRSYGEALALTAPGRERSALLSKIATIESILGIR
jgi:serine/threonine protein kinase